MILDNLDVYTRRQLQQIECGVESNVNVSIYADPKFDYLQMTSIRWGLEKGLDAHIYANTMFTYNDMEIIRMILLINEDPTEYITKITIENL